MQCTIWKRGINNTCSSQEQIGVHVNTFYLGTKSHNIAQSVEKKQKRMKAIPAKSRSQVFLKYNIILHNKARACLCHFASKELKDFDLTKYAHRTKQGVKRLSSPKITNYLSKCRELLLRTERKGIDFDCSNSLTTKNTII